MLNESFMNVNKIGNKSNDKIYIEVWNKMLIFEHFSRVGAEEWSVTIEKKFRDFERKQKTGFRKISDLLIFY